MSSWYFHKNLKPQGPLSYEEVKKKIMRGELGPADLLLKDEEGGSWAPALEWRDFPRELFPAFQRNLFKTSDVSEREWILLIFKEEGSRQEGPYSVEDIRGLLQAGSVSAEDYVWRSGMTGWVQLKDRSEFLLPSISRDL